MSHLWQLDSTKIFSDNPGTIQILVTAMAARDGAVSVYVHLPFCRTRCVFCDCHSVAAAHDHDERNRYGLQRNIRSSRRQSDNGYAMFVGFLPDGFHVKNQRAPGVDNKRRRAARGHDFYR